jgi:GINS complex subunit 1
MSANNGMRGQIGESSSTTFGRKALELVKEIARTDSIPQYNDELVKEVIEEAKAHYSAMQELADINTENDDNDDDDDNSDKKNMITASIRTHHESIKRNKKALMIYLNERMDRIARLRWTLGVGLPEDVAQNLSHSERDYFTAYSGILNKYMGRDKERGVNCNLTLDANPPKEHKIQVRALKDYGEIYTKDGEVDLKKDTVHLLWREDAQPLISEGVLEKLDDV